MNTPDSLMAVLHLLGWLMVLLALLAMAWGALAWHARRQQEREARTQLCDADTDYNFIDTAPARLPAARMGGGLGEEEDEKAKRKRLIAEAQWMSPWGW